MFNREFSDTAFIIDNFLVTNNDESCAIFNTNRLSYGFCVYIKYTLQKHTTADLKVSLDNNPATFVIEDRYRHLVSLLSLFNLVTRRKMAPSPIEESQMSPETIVKKIEEIGRCIMWMFFLASGGSYRFPELLILKYGGNDRNIFIDSQSRRLDIITGYSKSRAFKLLLKQLDETISAYVFHYIMVERVMLRLALTEEFAGMHRDLFEGMDEEDRIDVVTSTTDGYVRVPDNLREHSSNVLQSFLFVQPSRGTLVS